MLTLFELFGAVILFIWYGNGDPIHLFLAIHPWISNQKVSRYTTQATH